MESLGFTHSKECINFIEVFDFYESLSILESFQISNSWTS